MLFVPLFYFFRRSIYNGRDSKSGWALFLGSTLVIVMLFLDEYLTPSGFGASRWFYGFIYIVSFPVLIPLLACVFLAGIRKFSFRTDFAGFILLWLVPFSLYRSGYWISEISPLLPVWVPVLWTAQGIGIGFFIDCIVQHPRWFIIIISILGISALPLLAATSWWNFYSQQQSEGYLFLFICCLPVPVALVNHGIRGKRLKAAVDNETRNE